MSLVKPVQWNMPDTASAALLPLLGPDGTLRNLLVRLEQGNANYPLKGQRYRVANYTVVCGTGVFIDAASRRPLYHVSGWRLAE